MLSRLVCVWVWDWLLRPVKLTEKVNQMVNLENVLVYDIPSVIAAVSAILAAKLGQGNKGGIKEVHTLVNDRSEKQDKRIDQLEDSLEHSDTDIPPRPGDYDL